MINKTTTMKLENLVVASSATEYNDLRQHSEDRDNDLVRQTLAGNHAAFHELYTRHRPRMLHIAYRVVGNPVLAEDVLVEVFDRAYRRLSTFIPAKGDFATWLATLTWNESKRIAGQRRWQPAGESLDDGRDEPADQPSHEPSPEEQALDNELRRHLWDAVNRLPKAQRDAIILRYGAGLSFKEAAEEMGCAPTTVWGHIQRAFKALRPMLGAYYEPHDQ